MLSSNLGNGNSGVGHIKFLRRPHLACRLQTPDLNFNIFVLTHVKQHDKYSTINFELLTPG